MFVWGVFYSLCLLCTYGSMYNESNYDEFYRRRNKGKWQTAAGTVVLVQWIFGKTSKRAVLCVTTHYIIVSDGYKNVILTGLEWSAVPFVLLERKFASCCS